MSRGSGLRNLAVAAAAIVLATVAGGAEAAPKVAVITPYLAQPGTQFYVEGFQAAAKAKTGYRAVKDQVPIAACQCT